MRGSPPSLRAHWCRNRTDIMMINAMMSEELAAAKESGMLMHTDPERHTKERGWRR